MSWSEPRRVTKAVVAERPRRSFRMCPYCGRPCRGNACRFDMDLVAIERDLFTENNAPSRTTVTDARLGASTEGV